MLVGNVGTILGGITAFDRRPARRRPPRGRRRHRRGPVQWARVARAAWPRARPSGRRSSRRRAGTKIDVRFDRQDAVRARRRRPQADQAAEDPRRAGRASPSACPKRDRREHRDARSRDLGAHRRRRARDAAAHRSPPAARATRSCGCASADGFSHARSLAFVDRARARAGDHRRRRARQPRSGRQRRRATSSSAPIQDAVPGPGGRAAHRGGRPGAARRRRRSGTWRSSSGSSARSSRGTTAMGQLERGLNRIYGVEQDRPTLQKYGRAFLLALTAGGARRAAPSSRSPSAATSATRSTTTRVSTLWSVVRWPLALVLMVAAVAAALPLVARGATNRRGRGWRSARRCRSLLLVRSSRSASALFFRVSTSFGDTYGPLAGIVALLLWALLSSIAVSSARAVAAQLEAVRAGAPRAAGRREGRATPSPTPHAPTPSALRRRRRRASARPTTGVEPTRADDDRDPAHARRRHRRARRPRATASTSCATATRSSRRCSTRSTTPSTRSTS